MEISLHLTAPRVLAEGGAERVGAVEFAPHAACCHERGDTFAGLGLGSWTRPHPEVW